MAIPDFQGILLPLLKFYAKHDEVKLSDAVDAMAKHFKLTESERTERLAGGDYVFRNRVAWARQYLIFATLAQPVRRGVVAVTPLGIKWAAERTKPLKLADFKAIEGYERRVRPEAASEPPSEAHTEAGGATSAPEERLDGASRELRQAVITGLLDRILAKPPEFFERLVIRLMSKLGYGDGSEESMLHTGRTGDEGIDGKIKMDVLGVDQIFLQAKRYDPSNTVSREMVAAFAGSIAGAKGVFVTTSSFSKQATEFVRTSHKNIVLIDGQRLGELMLRSQLGVSVKKVYEVFAVDEDFFGEE